MPVRHAARRPDAQEHGALRARGPAGSESSLAGPARALALQALLLLVGGFGRVGDADRIARRKRFLNPFVELLVHRGILRQLDVVDGVAGVGGRAGGLGRFFHALQASKLHARQSTFNPTARTTSPQAFTSLAM